ncbi:Predicted periplasmic protein [Pasteurella testudinis DSM 23072]|uniref:Predicted periplasmic protein n=1 Tax=Pasteurella testudinis DSM 23072 TaxID=1122938 RepID=A0A1W1UQ13_9PAST|nr:MliC family protein [Pasteurella testudinis]SMB83150.1 Predicted periplasmic protein [Pasteurella testudinis DSM 23072]SUB50812.1 Membrane-bound lysozyme-inhibitor of c-type lysozyme [Pasteurella testudinis]
MIKTILFGAGIIFLTACHTSASTINSLTAPQQQSTSGSTASNKTLPSSNQAYLYHCENDTQIKVIVLNALAIKQHSKNPSIQLTLNGVSQHLQPVVSDSGKRYANIQWNWWEKAESAVLSNSLGEVIVSGCVKE